MDVKDLKDYLAEYDKHVSAPVYLNVNGNILQLNSVTSNIGGDNIILIADKEID
jgi:GTP cyclohydrolase III